MRPRKKVSSVGLDLIESFEGFRPQAAALPDGRWTIGYGHTQSARAGLQVTPDEARLLLLWDLRPVEALIDAVVLTPLNQNQYDALVAFAFNVGQEAFTRSDVLRLVNEGRLTQAACALDLWRKADIEGDPLVLDALIRRRAAEKDLFLSSVEGEAPPPTPSPLVRPEIDPAAAAAVPDRRPVELDAPLSGDVAAARVTGEVEPAPAPAAPIALVERTAPPPPPATRAWAGALSAGGALAAPAIVDAPAPEPELHPEPQAQPEPEPEPAPAPAPRGEEPLAVSSTVADAPQEDEPSPGEPSDRSAPVAFEPAAVPEPAALSALLEAANEGGPAISPERDADVAPEAEFAETEVAEVERHPAPHPEPAIAPVAEAGAVVVPLFGTAAVALDTAETLASPALIADAEPWIPEPSSWGVEPGQIAAVSVVTRLAAETGPIAPDSAVAAPTPAEAEAAPVISEPAAFATVLEAPAPVEAEATAAAIPTKPDLAAEAEPSATDKLIAELLNDARSQAAAALQAEPATPPPPPPAPTGGSGERVFASYGPMAFAFMKPVQRDEAAPRSEAEPTEARAPRHEPAPEPTPAPDAVAAPASPPAAPAPLTAPPASGARAAASNFGPMFVPETRTLAAIAPTPAITAEAPEAKPLVLTSPPSDWDDARYGTGATITALSADVDELETPLFDDGWDAPSVLSGRVVHHEAMLEPTPPSRSLRFGATGPYMLLGLIGFVAFAGALFAFWRGGGSGVGAMHDPKVLAWVLALIGAACVSISVYFLMKRLGGAED